MIYDYANGSLEPERRLALEEFLANDQESKSLLKNIENARVYVANLKNVLVEPSIIAHLLEAESAVSLGRRYSSWGEWPETLRWSITAIALSAIVASTVALVPWSKFSVKKTLGLEAVETAQIPQTHDDSEQVAANDDQGSGDEPPDTTSGDESSGDEVAESAIDDGSGDDERAAPINSKDEAKVAGLALKASLALSPTPAKSERPPESIDSSPPNPIYAFFFPAKPKTTPTPALVAVQPVSTPSLTPVSTPASTPALTASATPPSAPGTNASSQVAVGETADSHDSRDPKAKGFVYRAFMTLNDLDEIGPKMTADIIALGGEKAGEVELGWKRGNGRYYHFTLPETNDKKILERLQVYGPVRISKDPHPRVMPPGQVRFILWVESASQ